MKKSLIFVFILIFILLVGLCQSSIFCFAENEDIELFESLVARMIKTYDNGEGNVLTVAYLGDINEGENLLSKSESQDALPPELVEEFYQYRFYFYQAKAKETLEKTYVSATYTIKFENKSFFFYDEQWASVESVYNEYLDKIQSAQVGENFEAVFAEYYTRIDNLIDKTELDEIICEYVSSAVLKMDTAIVDAVNERLSQENLQTISKDNIPLFLKDANKEEYGNWFSEVLALGYSTQNALKIDRIHSKAIENLTTLSREESREKYLEIADNAISEMVKIKVETSAENDYLLQSRKESAIFELEYFFQSDAYTHADKDIKKEFDRLINKAIEDIRNADSVEKVNKILSDVENSLSDVEVGGKDWIKILVVGIVLFVALIVAIVFFILKKKKKSEKEIENQEYEETEENFGESENIANRDTETQKEKNKTRKDKISENTEGDSL